MKKLRSFSKTFQLLCVLVPFCHTSLKAQQELDVIRNWMHFTDAPNSLYRHLTGEAYPLLARRQAEVAAQHGLSAWQQRQQGIRNNLEEMLGPFPEKTPLRPKVMREVRKAGYRVEHVVFESQPSFYVTASLYIPAGLKNKAPAILYCSGHSNTGYRSAAYQRVILNLVKKGFLVLAFDPIGQGERLQYVNRETGKSRFKWPTWEHSYPGAQLFITGSSMARYMIWDGIRAIDYLVSRPEVDPQRIGVTGRSGGGTQSAYIAALDKRVKAAAPENYVTSYTRLLQSIGPQDAEQNFPQAIARGFDIGDLLLARAPAPTLMITTSRDIFSIQGSMETAEEIKAAYTAYNKPGNFRMVTDDAAHASTEKNRAAMYAFFQQHLGNPGNGKDEEITPLTEAELQVTTTGQVLTSLQGETVFSLNLREADRLNGQLQKKRQQPAYLAGAVQQARELSGYRAPGVAEKPVFTGRLQKDGYTIEKAFIKGEGDYPVPFITLRPESGGSKAVIYLHPAGKAADAGKEMEWLVKNGFTVLAPDLLGTGETGPGAFKGDSYIDSCTYNTWFAAMLTGRSIAGIRAGDVGRLAQVLAQDRHVTEICALAKEEMAPVLLHAAAFDKNITRVALVTPGLSYHSIATTLQYPPEAIQSTVPRALGAYDLPDLAASLAPRYLLIANSAAGAGELELVKQAYHGQHADTRLQVVPEAATEQLHDALKKWLQTQSLTILPGSSR
ncbi:alpha/beta hydrolase [Chitinophaga alhagiae]|uniref:alpha/beta hydrolase n=1 Tax=Chitinophaga alhagiae TaxID=2203219 RepID=UPI000E5C39E9|nr:alpha/beta hydrolase family protein [Chitinophaga alhagiae]